MCSLFVEKGLKSEESAMRKIATDYNGDCSRIKDLVRFTASFSTCARMKQFLLSLLSCSPPSLGGGSSRRPDRLEVLALTNKHSKPSALGYRDFNLALRIELEGGRSHICELQVNLEDMLVAKELTHGLYEEVIPLSLSLSHSLSLFSPSLTHTLSLTHSLSALFPLFSRKQYRECLGLLSSANGPSC